MQRKLSATRLTLWVNRAIALVLLALIFLMPALLNWYCNFRDLSTTEYRAILIAFYCCAVVSAAALWNLDRLLSNILVGRVFVRANVTRIRRIQWCCGGIALICLPAAVIYLPLCFMVVTMAFLSLVVGVVAQVMAAAVEIREENDLTI